MSSPTFLNYFTPDEVRVVECGEDGEYGLGEVWTTGSLGGVAQ